MIDYSEAIQLAVSMHLPGRTVQAIQDRGEWVRRIIEVTLDSGEIVFFKIEVPHQEPGWLQSKIGECHERDVTQILERAGLHVIPPVLVVDHSGEIIPYPYIIQARLGGTRLGNLLDQVAEPDARKIYQTAGSFYRSLHAIGNDRIGLWIGSTPDQPWGDPTGHMYQAEVVEGSGMRALHMGKITSRTYDRTVALWRANLDYLRDCQPALIHYSPFLWNIYLQPENGSWRVTKLMSVGDFMWWDRAYDVACLRYPPFGEMKPSWWEAFLRGYGPEPERKRILLYAVMQRLCAAMGSYWEPKSARNQAWTARALDDLDGFLDKITAL
jgi:Ser/Thr protein kinase RdoA (MazF antagonist)